MAISFSRARDQADHALRGDEQPVDHSPLPRVGDAGRVVKDAGWVERAEQSVVNHDIDDGDAEREPRLIQRDERDHDEEMEVHLDQAAAEVREDRRAGHEPERGQDLARTLGEPRQGGPHRERDDDGRLGKGMPNAVPRRDPYPRDDEDVSPQKEDDPAMPPSPALGR
jgi:hypothetical protein